MTLRDKKYIGRLIDKQVKEYLKVFGAISIEGPKWVGKTWTALNHANSAIFLDDDEMRKAADFNPTLLLDKAKPELIDEWDLVPKTWDAVRRQCDKTEKKGNYILTCSTNLKNNTNEIKHSGAGRIGRIKMYTMSLYESGFSSGIVSLSNLYKNKIKNQNIAETSINTLAQLIIRGGWPANLKTSINNAHIIPNGYIDAILSKDINDDKARNKNKMLCLLKSLARNESTIVANTTLLRDINENEKDAIDSRTTLEDYLNVLDRLYIVENQPAYSSNYRSPKRLGVSPKRHFTDPSLVAALLRLNEKKLLTDLNTFGFLYEALVERDLRIYIESLGGKLYHFRDNVTGLEVDSILEFSDGEYAAIEIKLGYNQVDIAKKNLMLFQKNMKKKPRFMCIIIGNTSMVYKDKDTGIYIFPITALKP